MKYNKVPSHYKNKFVFVATVICFLNYNKILY